MKSDFDGNIDIDYHFNDNGNNDSDYTRIANYEIKVESPENNTLITYIIPGACKDIYIYVCTAVLGDFIICLIMLISYNNSMLPNKACKPYIKRRRNGVAS